MNEMEPRMDDFKTLTGELAGAILRCEAECEGTQPPTSVRIAQLILAELLPDRLPLNVAGSSGRISVQ